MHQSLSKKNNHICPAENVGFVYSFSLFMNIDYKFQVCKRKTKTNLIIVKKTSNPHFENIISSKKSLILLAGEPLHKQVHKSLKFRH